MGALYTVVREGWDLNADGMLSLQELALIFVRLMAFPVHVLMKVMPAPVLGLFGLPPDAHWPSSALVAVLLSLPLWGIFVIGGLMVEAWLELSAEGSRKGGGPVQGMPRV